MNNTERRWDKARIKKYTVCFFHPFITHGFISPIKVQMSLVFPRVSQLLLNTSLKGCLWWCPFYSHAVSFTGLPSIATQMGQWLLRWDNGYSDGTVAILT